MLRPLLVSGFCLVTFLTFFCGIYRNDVPKSKYLALGQEPQFDCVGKVINRTDSDLLGSCVLIDSRHVLSAAHVFMKSDTREEKMRLNDSQNVIVYQPYNEHPGMASEYRISFKERMYNCNLLTIHPAYLDSATNGYCDIALLELDRPVQGVAPALLNAMFDELHTVAVGVGYGASGPAYPIDSVFAREEKVGGQNSIDTMSGFALAGKPTLLEGDFDNPAGAPLGKLGSAKSLPLEYSTAGGDSGGGLFRKKGSRWELIGVCAGALKQDLERMIKYGYYGQSMQWTRVSSFIDWIKMEQKKEGGKKSGKA